MLARLSRPIRQLTLLLAAIQFAMPGVASVFDGLDAGAGGRMTAHVENGAQKSCRPPHSADCAVCRFLSQAASKERTATPVFEAAVVAVIPALATRAHLDATRRGFNPRAPPVTLA